MTTEANQSGTRGHKITTSHKLSSRARVLLTRVPAPRPTPDGSIVPVTEPLLHYYTITPPRVTLGTHFTRAENDPSFFTITEKASTRAFSWLKAPTRAVTFKTLLRHYAKQVPKHGK